VKLRSALQVAVHVSLRGRRPVVEPYPRQVDNPVTGEQLPVLVVSVGEVMASAQRRSAASESARYSCSGTMLVGRRTPLDPYMDWCGGLRLHTLS
jgi:hypothetical protein